MVSLGDLWPLIRILDSKEENPDNLSDSKEDDWFQDSVERWSVIRLSNSKVKSITVSWRSENCPAITMPHYFQEKEQFGQQFPRKNKFTGKSCLWRTIGGSGRQVRFSMHWGEGKMALSHWLWQRSLSSAVWRNTVVQVKELVKKWSVGCCRHGVRKSNPKLIRRQERQYLEGNLRFKRSTESTGGRGGKDMSPSALAPQAVSKLGETLHQAPDKRPPSALSLACVCDDSRIILPFLHFFLLLTMELSLAPSLRGSSTGGTQVFWGLQAPWQQNIT